MDTETVVVTGGSRGIGAATVRALAASGTDVITCARDGDGLADIADSVADAAGAVTTQRADVRDEYDVERLLETASRAGNGIDGVVANAGVYHGGPGETPIDGESYTRFDDHVRTNARGVFATFRESVPHLTDDARLLLVSGSVAREPRAGFGSYAVSKAAAVAVARQFAADLERPVGIVDPDTVATGLTDDQGTDPEQAADLLTWALESADAELLDGEVIDRRTMRED